MVQTEIDGQGHVLVTLALPEFKTAIVRMDYDAWVNGDLVFIADDIVKKLLAALALRKQGMGDVLSDDRTADET